MTGSTKQSFKADSALRNPSERRRRSFTRSRQKFIETTVVVDQSMADFHGNQTVQYVMSIMNMVWPSPSVADYISPSSAWLSYSCNLVVWHPNISCCSYTLTKWNQQLLTIWSVLHQVHRLFRDQSIGHAIDIIITQLIILNTTVRIVADQTGILLLLKVLWLPQNPMNLTGEANKDLNNFCKWMHQRQEGKEPQRDLSLLLTRW